MEGRMERREKGREKEREKGRKRERKKERKKERKGKLQGISLILGKAFKPTNPLPACSFWELRVSALIICPRFLRVNSACVSELWRGVSGVLQGIGL